MPGCGLRLCSPLLFVFFVRFLIAFALCEQLTIFPRPESPSGQLEQTCSRAKQEQVRMAVFVHEENPFDRTTHALLPVPVSESVMAGLYGQAVCSSLLSGLKTYCSSRRVSFFSTVECLSGFASLVPKLQPVSGYRVKGL